jgi:hypothetical protein
MCRDGSPAGFAVNYHPGAEGLLVFLKGGAACQDATTCGIGNKRFGPTELEAYDPYPVIDRGLPGNPFSGGSYVFVPECTSDTYAGDRSDGTVPGVDGTFQFVGYRNYGLFLAKFASLTREAPQVSMFGCSAGGYGIRYNFGRTQAVAPDVPFTVFSDSSPALPDPYMPSAVQDANRVNWNMDATVLADCGASCPDVGNYSEPFFSTLLDRHSSTTFASIAYTEDTALPLFFGSTTQTFTEGLLAHRDRVTAAHPNAVFYLIGTDSDPAQGHCLTSSKFAGTTVGGVLLTDWIRATLDGTRSQVGP